MPKRKKLAEFNQGQVEADEQEELAQLELFEETPVSGYNAALGSAGDLKIEWAPRIRDRVAFSGEGDVVAVKFHDQKGRVRRIAIINADSGTVQIKPL